MKSSKDKLSEDQKRWIEANASVLKLPFKLVKIHKVPGREQSGEGKGKRRPGRCRGALVGRALGWKATEERWRLLTFAEAREQCQPRVG